MFRVPTSKFNDLTFLFDQYIHTLDGKSGSIRLVHDAKFISANTSLFCHFWRRPLFLFTRNIFSANMTELITIKVLRLIFFDFFWKEFLILNSQTDKLLKFYKYSLRHVNQDQCLFSNVYVTSNCVDLITKQKINN